MFLQLRNNGATTVALEKYEWDADAKIDADVIPFACIGDTRYNVFRVRSREGQAFSGAAVRCQAKVSNWPGLGTMRLNVPSGLLGGAIGTFTMLVFDAPTGESGAERQAGPLPVRNARP